ncbi:MAG: pyridoxal phosphate-dependent aminotransferase [Fibrobacterota bacterium]
MTIRISKTGQSIEQSPIRAMSIACRRAGGINLSQGVCDTDTPAPIIEGAKAAMDAGHNSYTRHTGIAPLRRAVADKEQAMKGVTLDPDREIVISAGATGAMFSLLNALCDPGDEIIMFEPYYGYHVSSCRVLGITIRFIPLTAPDWEIPRRAVEQAFSPKTRAVLVNTPGNPSGKVFTREELLFLGETAAANEAVLITDEIYEYFVYGDAQHISPLSIPQLRGHTAVVSGFSKTFSTTGWRIGYVVAPPTLAEACGHLSDLFYVCPPAPLQHGIAAGLRQLTPNFYETLRRDHEEKGKMLYDTLDELGFAPTKPAGAYYILADISRVEGSGPLEKAMTILKRSGVAGVPGSAFYHDSRGDSLCRFCFSKETAVIEQACRQLKESGI